MSATTKDFFASRDARRALRWGLYFLPLVLAMLLLAGFGVLFSRELRSTEEKLALVQEELVMLRQEATDAIASQSRLLEQQSADLLRQDEALQASKESEESLRETLEEVQEQAAAVPESDGLDGALIAELAPALVKLKCVKNSGGGIQRGTGMLFRGGPTSPFGEYYIQTNLHVIETEDAVRAQCAITLYPDPEDTSEYLVFESEGYKFYGNEIDLAFLTPEVADGEERAGSTADLARYARASAASPTCSAVSTGERISVLGYPASGGDTLTVTDGIVSGFETEDKVRYVKTSAKIDIGNSGGIAIKDSGCIVGIPTSVRQSRIESIGRVLDLGYLFSVTLR